MLMVLSFSASADLVYQKHCGHQWIPIASQSCHMTPSLKHCIKHIVGICEFANMGPVQIQEYKIAAFSQFVPYCDMIYCKVSTVSYVHQSHAIMFNVQSLH
jgi:hypothetical protein